MSANWGASTARRARWPRPARTPLWPPIVVYVCGCLMIIAAGLAMIALGGR